MKNYIKFSAFILILIANLFSNCLYGQIDEYCNNFTEECEDELLSFAQDVIDNEDLNCFQQFVYNSTTSCTTEGPIYAVFKFAIGTLIPINEIDIGINTGAEIDPYLSVTEGIIAKSLLVIGDEWCDYVFEPDYHLQTLDEVEKFIKQNKRLPGFKSEKEMVEEGYLNLEEITVKQQEKIEELFLYVIELNEEIDLLFEK